MPHARAKTPLILNLCMQVTLRALILGAGLGIFFSIVRLFVSLTAFILGSKCSGLIVQVVLQKKVDTLALVLYFLTAQLLHRCNRGLACKQECRRYVCVSICFQAWEAQAWLSKSIVLQHTCRTNCMTFMTYCFNATYSLNLTGFLVFVCKTHCLGSKSTPRLGITWQLALKWSLSNARVIAPTFVWQAFMHVETHCNNADLINLRPESHCSNLSTWLTCRASIWHQA